MVWVGVDVSKGTLDICPLEGECRRFRQPEELAEAVAFIAGHEAPHVVMESTGGYEQALFLALSRAQIPCSIVNPAHAHAFRRSLGKFAKTDAIDARLLAHMGHMHRPEPTALPSPERRKLEALVTRRAQLVKLLRAETNHAEHCTVAEASESIARVREALKREVRELDGAIKKLLGVVEELREASRVLQSVPGVGPTVAAGVLVHLPELGRVAKSEIAALAGLAPYARESGIAKGHRSIRAGRTPVRALLYMAALVASRHNARLRATYARLLSAGKSKKVALIAVARKLLVMLNAMLKHNETWRDEPRLT
jgi:transposase